MINLKRGKKGDTVRWNAKKKSGWIYDGTWWRHYRNGKPTGKKEKHRRNAQAQLKGLGVEQVARFFTATPSQEHFERMRKRKAERKEKLKLKKQKERETANEVLNQTSKTSKKPIKKKNLYDKYGDRLKNISEKSKKETKNKEILKRAKENLKKPKDSPKPTSSSSSPKKRMTAREKMRAKNVERFGQEHVDKLRAKHADFKKMKKREMSRADFIKKYPKSQTAKRSRR